MSDPTVRHASVVVLARALSKLQGRKTDRSGGKRDNNKLHSGWSENDRPPWIIWNCQRHEYQMPDIHEIQQSRLFVILANMICIITVNVSRTLQILQQAVFLKNIFSYSSLNDWPIRSSLSRYEFNITNEETFINAVVAKIKTGFRKIYAEMVVNVKGKNTLRFILHLKATY